MRHYNIWSSSDILVLHVSLNEFVLGYVDGDVTRAADLAIRLNIDVILIQVHLRSG